MAHPGSGVPWKLWILGLAGRDQFLYAAELIK